MSQLKNIIFAVIVIIDVTMTYFSTLNSVVLLMQKMGGFDLCQINHKMLICNL